MHDSANDVLRSDEFAAETLRLQACLARQDRIGGHTQMAFKRLEGERDRRGRGDDEPARRCMAAGLAEQSSEAVNRNERAAKTRDAKKTGITARNGGDFSIGMQAGDFGQADGASLGANAYRQQIVFDAVIDVPTGRKGAIECQA